MDVTNRRSLIIIVILLLFIGTATSTSASKTMVIELSSSIISSNEYLTVSVFDPSITNETPYLTDVILQFNDEIYEISSEDDIGEILIQVPQVPVNTTYILEAFKEGYSPTNVTISVLPGESTPSFELHITLIKESNNVNAYQEFFILVTDMDGIPIQGAIVSIQGMEDKGYVSTTDAQGQTSFIAPNIDEITIITDKQGYESGALTFWVITQPDSYGIILSQQYLPVAIAVIILMTVIIYVTSKNRLRENDSLKSKKLKIKRKNPLDHINNDRTSMDEVEENEINDLRQVDKQNDPKIEEIHIPSNRPNTEVFSIKTSKEKGPETEQTSYRWFDKSTEADKKVDELPNSSSLKDTDKWFVGTDNVRKKIDDTIKDKDKKIEKKVPKS